MDAAPWITRRTRHYTACCRRDLSTGAVERLAADPHELLLENAGRPVKISRESLIVMADIATTDGPVTAAVKRFAPRSWWKAVLAPFRLSRARIACRRAQSLAAHGIATPQPLATVAARGCRRLGVSYLVTEWIDGAENLHLFGWRVANLLPAERGRRADACAASLGRLLGRLHAVGVDHRDLKAANLLVVERDGQAKTYLVDLDGMRAPPALPLPRRAANLARLAVGLAAHPWVSRTTVGRFFRAYFAESPADNSDRKRLWREVARIAAEMNERKRWRGGPVL